MSLIALALATTLSTPAHAQGARSASDDRARERIATAPITPRPAVRERRPDEPRVRFGLDLAPGGGVAEAVTRGETRGHIELAFDLRVGVQLDDQIAVLYQATALLAFLPGCRGDVCSGLPGGMHLSSIVGELTVDDRFQVSLGPTFAWGVMAYHGKPSPGGGGVARIGWTGGGRPDGDRNGFSIALEIYGVYLAPHDEPAAPIGGIPRTIPSGGGAVLVTALALGWDTF